MKTISARAAARFAAALCVLAFAATGSWAQMPQVILPLKSTPVQAKGLGVKSGALPVRFNAAAMKNARLADEVELSLPDGTRQVYVHELFQDHGGGVFSWVGQHKDYGDRHRAIVTTGPSGSFGLFSTPHGSYRLVPGPGYDLLVDMTAEQMHLPLSDLRNDMLFAPPAPKGLKAAGQASPYAAVRGLNTLGFAKIVADTTVDIMFVYTRGFAENLGANLMTRLNFLVTTANTAYLDSQIPMALRLVNATMVDYTDAGSNGPALNAITPGCTGVPCSGYDAATFGAAQTIRNNSGADVVAFLRNGGSFSGSGLAWVNGTTPNASFMFSVTTGCVMGCESVFVHEVGHNMGNMHDRATVAWQSGGTSSYVQDGAYSYSYGYYYCASGLLSCNPELPPGSGGCAANTQPECSTAAAGTNNFSEIMAYFHATTLRNMKFSNPGVTCAGSTPTPLPCGIADGFAGSANTALSMSNQRAGLSAIKTATVAGTPGALQFTAGAASGIEGGNIVFNVSRVGGSSGPVTVYYFTNNGSATGADYGAVVGMLNWADGDTANKTITIPIPSDGSTENAETFTVTLTDPGGGAFLGYPTVATGIILGTWPPGGVMPSGFVTPDGSDGAWTVASDQSYDAPSSLRSHNVLAAVQGTYVNSDLTYTATFVSGTVGFAHKVSAYPSFGALEFMVDGVVVMTNSAGSSAWQYYTTAITAGVHTLKWRFKNRLSFPCADAFPDPSIPEGCADRAWIDSVALPLPAATVATATDFNKDAKSDLLWRNSSTGQVFRIFMNGLAPGAGALIYNEPNVAWKIVSDADFNGDGVTDLLWRNDATGLVFVTTLSDTGVVSGGAVVFNEPNTAWKIIHTPDFNGDGKADLLYWNSSTGQLYGILMDGFIPGAQGLIYTEPNTAWRIVAVGDFSGSGKRNQLLYRNSSTGQVYLMTVSVSGGVFSQSGQMIYQEANTAWKIVAAADFNGDGKSDILWRNDADGRVYMMHMNGPAIGGAAMVYQEANLAWKVVAVGDYNGDGKADLLWRNDSTGQVFAMLMNGFAISSANLVYYEPNTAWKILGPLEYAQ